MTAGRRRVFEPLEAIRERARAQREALPPALRALAGGRYEVRLDPALARLRDRLAES